MNLLNLETSPYLLQHANNPIHWQSWTDKTLATAQKENKLIIISIGYSACHWCHVMEHETFEDHEVAAIMNPNFVSIKVDREERPDVDAIYMKAVQMMTNQGGWPLNVVCLPDGRPVWGGTYFRKEEWTNTLQQLHDMYQKTPQKIEEYAKKLHEGIKLLGTIDIQKDKEPNKTKDIRNIIEKWSKSFDWEYGGYAKSPKFMMPNNLLFLQRYGYQKKSKEILDFVDLTLTKMAHGGLFDTVGGGFSRYSVDIRWHVPHFEKMLYDNGQLVSLYAQAYKRTKKEEYKTVIEKTLNFIAREFLNPDYGFYAALDADSLNPQNHLEEGAFYVWTIEELKQILAEDFKIFSAVFNINDFGFWEASNYVLIQSQTLKGIAKQYKITAFELETKKRNWEEQLFIAREKRAKPRLDDKTLTSWNAIMMKGYLEAYQALGNEEYLTIATKNAQFIIEKQWSAEGYLYHSYKNNKSSIIGFLEDYAFTIDAFICLYLTTLVEKYVHQAKELMDYCFDYFYDEKQQFFTFNARNTTPLIAQHFENEDNVIPASNSVMANNLHVLSILFGNSYYEKVALQMLNHITPTIDYGSAYSNWLNLKMNQSEDSKELAICGPNALENCIKINAQYNPNILCVGTTNASTLAIFKDRLMPNEDLFYLCQNKSCNLPKETINEIFNELNK